MIQLTKDLAMTADEHCYIVGKPRQRADKGTVLDKLTYYPTAAQAVSGALSRTMRQGVADGSITTLLEFVQEQERLRDELEKLLAPLEDVGKAGERRKQLAKMRDSASETGRARRRQDRVAAPTGNYIPKPLDGEK